MNTIIRELKYSDRRKLSNMIKKLSVQLNDNSLLNLIQSSPNKHEKETDGNDDRLISIGVNLLNVLIQFLEEEITEWFADLIGVEIEEFLKEAPFDIEIIIIDQLIKDGGQFKSFLSGASRLYNMIKLSLGKSLTPKEL